jgi:uncharacterized membrane protein
MNILLVNQNPAVSRLITLSSGKYNFTLEEINILENAMNKKYDAIFIDSELFTEDLLLEIKSKFTFIKFGFIASRREKINNDFFDFILTKPFLPTELENIVASIKSDIEEDNKEDIEKDD